MKKLLLIMALTLLTACGGGGGGGGGDPAPPKIEVPEYIGPVNPIDPGPPVTDTPITDTPVTDIPITDIPVIDTQVDYNLAALQAGDVGPIYSFDIKGFHSIEGELKGSISVTKRDPLIIEGIQSFPIDTVVTFTFIKTNETISATARVYVDESGYLLTQYENEAICVPVYIYRLPDTVRIYDFDNFPDIQCDDAITIRANWKIENAGDGNIYYIINMTFEDYSYSTIATQTQIIKLTQDGQVLSYRNETHYMNPSFSVTLESI